MRVVLSSWGSRGDIAPLAALAKRIRELGGEVTVCAPPDEEFVELLAGVGVPLVPLGPTVKSVVRAEKMPDVFALAAEMVASRFEVLPEVAAGSDVILATGLFPAGVRSVAEKLGIRYVYAAFLPFQFPSEHYPAPMRPGKPTPPGLTDSKALWDLDAERLNELYGKPDNAHRAAIGLPPVDNSREYVFTERPWLSLDPLMGTWPGLDVVRTGAWILPDERPLPADLAAFLADGEPPVYVGFGSMAMRTAPDLAQVVVDAVAKHGRRLVVSRGWADLAPDGCFVVGDVNHRALFPRVAAVVHHGGIGTTTTAALAGAPQVIVPQVVDQPYWAARIAELGIGAAHDGPVPTVDSLTAALGAALAPEIAVRAKEVAGMVRTDGTTVAAELLLRPEG